MNSMVALFLSKANNIHMYINTEVQWKRDLRNAN